jgi:membrane protease YdiL (CAAX protease family)
MRRRGITVFLLITFGGFWGYTALAHLAFGWSLANPLVQLPGGFMPAIAAIVVRRSVTREGFADAGSKLWLRTAWRYYLLAWLGPLGVAAAVVAIAAAAGRTVRMPSFWALPILFLLLALATVVLFWGEEFGWTGYLLRRVCPGRPRLAAVVAGVIAGVWHWPLALLGYAEFPNLAVGLLGWTAWIVCQEIILAWLRARSGSVWPACLAHAGNNMVLVTLTNAMLDGPGGVGVLDLQLLTVLVLAAVAAVPLLRAHRETAADPM